MSNLREHAERELTLAGMNEPGADYDGQAARDVMALIELFASQGHSGGSAGLVLVMFDKLARFQPLTELTDDPAEWIDVTGENGGGPLWQSTRKPDAFSTDGGKTWYSVETPETMKIINTSKHQDLGK